MEAAMLCVRTAAICLTLAFSGPALSQTTETLFPQKCAVSDLALVTEIEAQGASGASVPKLVLASEVLLIARAECATRSEARALSMYSTTIRMLQEPSFGTHASVNTK